MKKLIGEPRNYRRVYREPCPRATIVIVVALWCA